jgi:hypothetical protein
MGAIADGWAPRWAAIAGKRLEAPAAEACGLHRPLWLNPNSHYTRVVSKSLPSLVHMSDEVTSMSQEELLLQCWRNLPPAGQARVLAFTQLLHEQESTIDLEDLDFGAPEHLRVRSQEQLDRLLQEGLDSLDRAEGIEATEAWWDAERARLVAQTQA